MWNLEVCNFEVNTALTTVVMGLVVISVSLYISVITQWGYSPLMEAAWWGRTEVVSLLVKAGATLDLQDKVNM